MQGILSGVAGQDPVILLVSADGRGKSTFLSCLGPAASVMAAPTDVVIVTGALPSDWLEGVATAFDLREPAGGRAALIDALGDYLGQRANRGSRVVIAIDDAHRLSRAAMAEILSFARGWPLGAAPTTFLLAGTLDLPDRLTAATTTREVRGLPRFSLAPWGIDDLSAYIRHRLARQAGGHERFSPEAIARVHELSAGEPATVSQMVGRALQVAHMLGESSVARTTVEHAVTSLASGTEELELPTAKVRPLFPLPDQGTFAASSVLADSADLAMPTPLMPPPPYLKTPTIRQRWPKLGLAAAVLALAIGGAWLWSEFQSPGDGGKYPASVSTMDRDGIQEHEREAGDVPPSSEPGRTHASSATASVAPSETDRVASAEAVPFRLPVRVGGEDTANLMARGDALMLLSDISAAREFYLLAARRGDPAAYTAVAGTFDPVFLQKSGVKGARGDATQAVEWYRQAIARGEPLAQSRLAALLSHLQASGAIDPAEANRLLGGPS